jgi:hypothetical protein
MWSGRSRFFPPAPSASRPTDEAACSANIRQGVTQRRGRSALYQGTTLVGRKDENGADELLLKRSDVHESVLLTMRREMRNRSSKLRSDRFTAEDFATCFGLTEIDIEKTISWMRLQGLKSLTVSPDRTSIAFSGDLLAVEAAFSTEFHRYRFEGRGHFTSAYDLSVPRALAPVISCFRNLRIPVSPSAAKQKETGVWKRQKHERFDLAHEHQHCRKCRLPSVQHLLDTPPQYSFGTSRLERTKA